MSVGEEIVDAFVRSCGSPICGSPRPRTPSLEASPTCSEDSRDELEDDYEVEESSFEPGCSLEEEDEFEVDEVIEIDEVLTIEVEDLRPELCKAETEKEYVGENVEKYKTKEDSSKCVNVVHCTIHEENEGGSKSGQNEDVVSEDTRDKAEREEDERQEASSEGKEAGEEITDNEDETYGKSEATSEEGTVRRKRLLPEIPKNKKCKY